MIKVGDKIVLKKEMGAFKNIGEKCEVIGVEDNVISFKFGGGLHCGCMSEDELEKYFTVEAAQPSTVTEEMVNDIIKNSAIVYNTIFDKCTVASTKLPNGFIIVEYSASVLPENYDEEMGKEICMRKIRDKIWELEGYRLQQAISSRNTQKTDVTFDPFDW